jgi:hypothetical protein
MVAAGDRPPNLQSRTTLVELYHTAVHTPTAHNNTALAHATLSANFPSLAQAGLPEYTNQWPGNTNS